MSAYHRRLDRLAHRGRPDPFVNHPARIPAWVRPWLDPLAIDDPEILEAGGFVPEAGGDATSLSPEDRERFHELVQSWETFCEGLDHER